MRLALLAETLTSLLETRGDRETNVKSIKIIINLYKNKEDYIELLVESKKVVDQPAQ